MLKRISHAEAGREVHAVRYGRPGGPQVAGEATLRSGIDGAIQLEVDGPRPDPYVLEDFRRHGSNGMRLTFRVETDQPFKLALLSWAMLSAFQRFGYSFALGRASRAPRKAILGRTLDPVGEAACFSIGPWPTVVPRFSMAVVMAQRAKAAPIPGFDFVSLGATAGPIVVCLPFEDDEDAQRIRSLQQLAPTGNFVRPVIPISFNEYYEKPPAFSETDRACQYFVELDDGSRLAVVATSPEIALQTLAMATASETTRHRVPGIAKGERDDAPSRLPDLSSEVSLSGWTSHFLEDLDQRLAGLGEDRTIVTELRSADVDPDYLIGAVAGRVPPHLAMHLRDAYQLFIVGARPIEPEEAGATGQFEHYLDDQLRAQDLWGKVWYAYSAGMLNLRPGMSTYEVVLTDSRRSVSVGPFYTVRTMFQAISEALAAWSLEDSRQVGERPKGPG